MAKSDRRDFLRSSALAACALGGGAGPAVDVSATSAGDAPDSGPDLAEALRVCTLHGAHASFEEKLKGSITPGKLADFVILAEDPHRVRPDQIKEIRVVRTVVGGRTVHPKELRDAGG
jgi:predicted amidohydrolase YtcJ